MNNIGEKYLPIGTVLMLKGGSKRVMITGFCSMAVDDQNEMFDYSGCMYPEGFLSSDQTALFNHEQIEKIYHMGLIDDEEQKFKVTLNGVLTQMNNVGVSIQNQSAITEQQTVIPVQTQTMPGASEGVPTTGEQIAVPPVGPGLPGYNASVENQAQLSAEVAPSNIQFDANGTVISAQPNAEVAPSSIQFDANGTVISAQPSAEVSPSNIQFDANGTVTSA